MRFRFILAEKANHSVRRLCAVLGVTRAGFYAWRKRPPSQRAKRDAVLRLHVRGIFEETRRSYGSPRVYRELRARSERVGRHRVARLMRQEHLFARKRRRFCVTTVSDPQLPAPTNLVARRFTSDGPNRVWAGDITYFPTREGWLYLAVLLDLFSRKVVGWAMSDRIDHELVCRALEMAVSRRAPTPGLICHSDRGSQYASEAYQRRLVAVGARCSMSRRGDCWDNAVVESFNSSLKVELALPPTLSRAEVKAEVFDYLEAFYNPKRRHSTLGYLSPAEFEAAAMS